VIHNYNEALFARASDYDESILAIYENVVIRIFIVNYEDGKNRKEKRKACARREQRGQESSKGLRRRTTTAVANTLYILTTTS